MASTTPEETSPEKVARQSEHVSAETLYDYYRAGWSERRRRTIRRHLEKCARCRRQARRVQFLLGVIDSWSRPDRRPRATRKGRTRRRAGSPAKRRARAGAGAGVLERANLVQHAPA